MKLSTKQQLLKEANSELKRLRKMAGLSESKKPLNEAIAFVKGQRVNVPSRYIMKCHTATPDKYVYGNSMYKVGDFVGTDGKPTKNLQKAQIFDKEDANMWEDTYTTGEIEKYSKAIREPDFNGVYSLGAFFKPVAFKVGGLSESKKPLNEGIAKVLSDVSTSQSEDIYDDLSALKNKFYAEQTKKLNNLYKKELQQYVGKVFTDQIVKQIGRGLAHASSTSPKRLIGNKIISMSFDVQDGAVLARRWQSYDEVDVILKVRLEGNKSTEFLV